VFFLVFDFHNLYFLLVKLNVLSLTAI
jgi:hypothetical protein